MSLLEGFDLNLQKEKNIYFGPSPEYIAPPLTDSSMESNIIQTLIKHLQILSFIREFKIQTHFSLDVFSTVLVLEMVTQSMMHTFLKIIFRCVTVVHLKRMP